MSRDGRRIPLRCGPPELSQDTSSGSRESAVRCGARSTDCPTGARSSARSEASGRARPAARGLLHEAHRGGVAARRPAPGGARRAARHGPHRPDLRRRRRRVPALPGRRPAAQAVDGARRGVGDPQPPTAAVRRAAARGHHRAGGRPLGAPARRSSPAVERDEAQGHRDPPRGDGARVSRLRSAGQSGGEGREAAADGARGDRRLQPGGGPRAGERGRLGAGRSDLPDGGFHRPASGRAGRTPMARRRLRRRVHPRDRELHERRAVDAEERQGPVGAHGPRRSARRWRGWGSASDSSGRTSSSSSDWSVVTSTRLRCCGATAAR